MFINKKYATILFLMFKVSFRTATYGTHQVAVKEMALGTDIETAHFKQEVALMQRLTHPNVCRFYGATTTTGKGHVVKGHLVLELLGVSLREALHVEGKCALLDTEPGRRTVLRHVIEGMAYLHPKITHADLKPAKLAALIIFFF